MQPVYNIIHIFLCPWCCKKRNRSRVNLCFARANPTGPKSKSKSRSPTRLRLHFCLYYGRVIAAAWTCYLRVPDACYYYIRVWHVCPRPWNGILMMAYDKFTPTKYLTPPLHNSSRPAAAHTDTETPLLHQKKGVGPVDGPPQPIWPIVGPPKHPSSPPKEGLGPGPGGGGQSKGTWTLNAVFSPSTRR